jgi:hypothetical protein
MTEKPEDTQPTEDEDEDLAEESSLEQPPPTRR